MTAKWRVLCGGCRKKITAVRVEKGEVIEALNKLWHREHFVCYVCQLPVGIADHDHIADVKEDFKAQPLCKDCFFDKRNIRCGKCDHVLRESYVVYNGQNMHQSCFVCVTCSLPFARNKFYMADGQPECDKCHFETNSESSDNSY